MKPGDKVELRVTHAGGLAQWMAAQVKSIDEAKGLVWVKTAAASFAVTVANVRPAGGEA